MRDRAENRWTASQKPVRDVIRNFSPQFFLLCMATGGLALNLQTLPYQFNGLGVLSIIVWVFDFLLWITFITLFVLRCFLHTSETVELFKTEIEVTDYLSTLSISSSTLIEMLAIVCGKIYAGADVACAVLFWIDLAIALVACILPYWLMIRFEHIEVNDLPPTILYPATAIVSTASLGAVVCQYTTLSVRASYPIWVVSYILVGFGFFLALAVMALFTGRLITAQTPEPNKACTHLVPCAALGNATYAVLLLGRLAGPYRNLPAEYGKGYIAYDNIGNAMYAASIILGLFFFGLSIFWLILAVIIVMVDQRKADFDLNFWSALYPTAVLGLATNQLSIDFDSSAFRTVSTMFACILLLLWLYGMARTVPKMMTGEWLLPDPDKEKQKR